MSNGRKNIGRQKIEIKKITNESNLLVSFSKRRGGLFKKASELCTLCGANVALLTFSPAGKVFSFGHPNVDVVIYRYLMQALPQNTGTVQFMESRHTANVSELNTMLEDMNNQIENEQKRGEELNHFRKVNQAQFWWANPNEDMNIAQLKQIKVVLGELKKNASHPTQQFFAAGASSSTPSSTLNVLQPPPQPQMLPQQLMMQQSHMFDARTMMTRHHGF